jgi:hypothetical protein
MTYELTAGVVICPTCYRVGAGRCVCSPERAYASDEAYAEAMWLASLRRAEPDPVKPPRSGASWRRDGYRYEYTLDGPARGPGVTR